MVVIVKSVTCEKYRIIFFVGWILLYINCTSIYLTKKINLEYLFHMTEHSLLFIVRAILPTWMCVIRLILGKLPLSGPPDTRIYIIYNQSFSDELFLKWCVIFSPHCWLTTVNQTTVLSIWYVHWDIYGQPFLLS